jgi:hypothetical protein
MKTLSPDDIDCLLGIRACDDHPLDILGYGYSSEGARRFRSEQPDFLPQIVAYIQNVLMKEGIFPKQTNLSDPGFKTFIQSDRGLFRVSSVEEVGFSKLERIVTNRLPAIEAIQVYIRKVTNPDYVHSHEPSH